MTESKDANGYGSWGGAAVKVLERCLQTCFVRKQTNL